MGRPYTGSADAVHSAKRPGTEMLLNMLLFLVPGTKNLGVFSNRDMRGKPGQKSVHATWRAFDIGYPNPDAGRAIVQLLEQHADSLLIEEIHDYAGVSKAGTEKWGRGWRCTRKEFGGGPGWRDWSAEANGGTPGGKWIHVEVAPAAADDASIIENAFKKAFSAL